jgi:hypothetical protein
MVFEGILQACLGTYQAGQFERRVRQQFPGHISLVGVQQGKQIPVFETIADPFLQRARRI